MNISSLQGFILKEEQNLHIAHAISEVWPETRQRIGEEFLDRLTTSLLTALPAWKTDRWEVCFEHRWASFNFYKSGWDHYWIDLQFAEYGTKMQFGVVRSEELATSSRSNCPEFLDAVQEYYPSAKANKWWEGAVAMRTPASDWRVPEVLWRMHTDASFLQAVSDQMITLAKATEPILDRRNKPGR